MGLSDFQLTEPKEATPLSVLERIQSLDITSQDRLDERERMAEEMVFVLPGIAARGQSTIIYADSNSGKTLVTVKLLHDQAEAGELKDLTVVYCNFDDDFRGANQKAKYCQPFDNILMVDRQSSTPDDILKMISDSIDDGTASKLCFILDTAIRFVSDSDKGTQRTFTDLIGKFIAAQGTIIALGHTNKHKSAEGKSVHGGTGDIRNSFSQCAMLELETSKDTTDRRVRFYNDKLRGMAKVSTSYRYKHGDDRSWLERVETVERIDQDEADRLTKVAKGEEQHDRDSEIIDAIIRELESGPKSHTYLSKDIYIGTRSQRDAVLMRYDQSAELSQFRFWGKSRGQTGGTNYHLLESLPTRKTLDTLDIGKSEESPIVR